MGGVSSGEGWGVLIGGSNGGTESDREDCELTV